MRIIAGYLGGRILKTGKGDGYRPAMGKTREALFSMLEARGIAWSHVRALDLYAGTGSLAFEAISRGAPHALMVENAQHAIHCLRQNIESLGLQNAVILWEGDVLRRLKKPPAEPYSLVFMDPPYGKNLATPTFQLLNAHYWLTPGAFVTAEIEKNVRVTVPSHWQPEGDRLFGQTRILIWQVTDIHNPIEAYTAGNSLS
ncbi:MAG: RsmD family RNA methyltransferase [Desulfovibrio sp.]|nr:RsmD family RNA methyltransferase [Desulfovibrio sp.]